MKVGDIVKLKSGGCYMTISYLYDPKVFPEHIFTCRWHDNLGRPQSADYGEAILKLEAQ